MTILNITTEESPVAIQDKLQKIRVIQDSIKYLQETIVSDIKQRDYIISLREKIQNDGDEYCTNEYIPHPADSARDIKTLEARINSKHQKIIFMQQEISVLLNKNKSASGAAA